MSGINVDRDALLQKSKEISEIDVVLDANSGSKAAGKRSVSNALMADGNSDFVTQVVSQLRDNFEGESLVATYLRVVDALEDEFDAEADALINSRVEAQASDPQDKKSDEEISALNDERKELVQQFKALKSILEMFGTDVSDVPDPKIRRGGAGPRGPRTLSKFQYTVNNTELEPEVNSLSTVAKLCGNIKVKDLKEHITSQGVDLTDPPAEWSAELPNEVGTLTATVLPEFKAEFEEDEDEEEETSSETETVDA